MSLQFNSNKDWKINASKIIGFGNNFIIDCSSIDLSGVVKINNNQVDAIQVNLENSIQFYIPLTDTIPNSGTQTLGDLILDLSGLKAPIANPAFTGNVSVGGTVTSSEFIGDLTGNADTVTTNANLTGDITSTGNATAIAAGVIINADVKSDAAIAYSKMESSSNAPTWNQNTTGSAATVTTNANLTGDITSVGNATSIAAGVIINADVKSDAAITYSKMESYSNAPTWNQNTTGSASYSFTSGNAATVTTNANLTGDITSVGNATSIASGVIINADVKSDAAITYSKMESYSNAPTWNQNTTGSASYSFTSGNAATVTTNANLTGDITSVGNATSIAAGVIINADVKSDAAITYSKMESSSNAPTWNQNTTGSAATSTTAGTVTTAAQTIITSLGNLTGLTVAGLLSVGTMSGNSVPTNAVAVFSKDGITEHTDGQIFIEGAGNSQIVFGESQAGSHTRRCSIGYNNAGSGSFAIHTNREDALVVDYAGNVGINVISPANLLTVEEYTANTSVALLKYNSTNAIGSAKGLKLWNSDGTVSSKGGIHFAMSRNNGAEAMGAAIIIGRAESWTTTASTNDSYMAFGTSIDGVVAEKMRIHINGNVGIGTQTPVAKLDLVESASYTPPIQMTAPHAVIKMIGSPGTGYIGIRHRVTSARA